MTPCLDLTDIPVDLGPPRNENGEVVDNIRWPSGLYNFVGSEIKLDYARVENGALRDDNYRLIAIHRWTGELCAIKGKPNAMN